MYIQVTCNIVSCISCSTQHVPTVRVTLLGLCGCVCVWVWGCGRVSVSVTYYLVALFHFMFEEKCEQLISDVLLD